MSDQAATSIVTFSSIADPAAMQVFEGRQSEDFSLEDRMFLNRVLGTLQEAETHPGVMSAPDDRAASVFQSYLAANPEVLSGLRAAMAQKEEKFDNRDLRWIKLAVAELRRRLGRERRDPRPGVPSDVLEIGTDAKVAILGDWGTDLYGAEPAARRIAAQGDYDLLVHLGDIYYSGSHDEVEERFLTPWRIMEASNPRAASRACNGNHEMYSGGKAFFEAVLGAFDQTSTMFAARNDNWLLVGLDTAYNDHDLDDDQSEWLEALVGGHPGHKLILFSHHQPYSQLSGQGEKLVARLEKLLDANRVFAWYWGHEHLFAKYERTKDWPFLGRCNGHGGFPYFRDARLASARRTPLSDGVDFCHFQAKESPVRGPIPAGDVLDGPNEFLGEHKEQYGPHGYMRLEINGEKLTESLWSAAGTQLWSHAW